MKNTKEIMEQSSIKNEFIGDHKIIKFIEFIQNLPHNLLFVYTIYAIALGELDYKFNLEYKSQLNSNENVKIVIFDDIGCMSGRAGVAILDVRDNSIIMIKTMRMA